MHMLLNVLLLPLLAAVPADGGGQTDLKQLEGKWIIVSAKTGNPQIEQTFLGKTVAFSKGMMQSWNAAGEPEDTGKFTLRPEKTPKEIDVHPEKESKKGPLLGIYALEGGTLKLCWSKNVGRDRPSEFEGNARLRHVYLVLERAK